MVAKPKHITPVGRGLGWKPDRPDPRDYFFRVVHAPRVTLPPKVSLRDGMPPVFDQGQLGSCTAHAGCAAIQFVHGGPTSTPLSRLELYYDVRRLERSTRSDAGGELRDVVKAANKWGVAPESEWPYDVSKFARKPSATVYRDSKQFAISQYSRLLSRSDFQQALVQGLPVIFGFTVFESIDSDQLAKTGVMMMPQAGERDVGGHAVCLVGYDNSFRSNPVVRKAGLDPAKVPNEVYEVRNSWSASWGDAGYFWMPAAYVENPSLSSDFWTIQK